MRSFFLTVSFLFTLHSQARADIILGTDFEKALNTTEAGIDRVWISNMGPDGKPRPSSQDPENLSRRSKVVSLSGQYSWRFGLSYFFDYRHYNDGNPDPSKGLQKPRTAIGWTYHDPSGESARLQINKEYWIGIAYYFPEEYIFDYDDNPENLFQLHKIGDGRHVKIWDEDSESFQNRYTPAAIFITLNGNAMSIGLADNYNRNGQLESLKYVTEVNRGRWHQIVFHFKFTQKGAENSDEGFFEVYMDGNDSPVLATTGPNSLSTEFKLTPNFYKYGWHCRIKEPSYQGPHADARRDYEFAMTNPNPTRDNGSINTERYFYIDNVFLGDENSSISEVAPNWSPIGN